MQHKLLSIVIPVFNIEQYIAKCIESFEKVNEKYYSLFELIIVNDGSTDSSLQVIEKMLEESSLKARIISKENGGHGSTINVGIKEAKGKYFKVIDGDDWIDVQSFETFLENLSKIDVDMIITNYTEQHIYNQTKKEISFSDKLEQDKVYHGIPFRRIPMHAVTFKTAILKENNIHYKVKDKYLKCLSNLTSLTIIDNMKNTLTDELQNVVITFEKNLKTYNQLFTVLFKFILRDNIGRLNNNNETKEDVTSTKKLIKTFDNFIIDLDKNVEIISIVTLPAIMRSICKTETTLFVTIDNHESVMLNKLKKLDKKKEAKKYIRYSNYEDNLTSLLANADLLR